MPTSSASAEVQPDGGNVCLSNQVLRLVRAVAARQHSAKGLGRGSSRVASERPIVDATTVRACGGHMFVQVIQGRVSDAGQARGQLDRWQTELAPSSIGWLGTTAGVTDDGTVVVLARSESEQAARQNSDRPEQSAWWEATAY